MEEELLLKLKKLSEDEYSYINNLIMYVFEDEDVFTEFAKEDNHNDVTILKYVRGLDQERLDLLKDFVSAVKLDGTEKLNEDVSKKFITISKLL